LAGWEEPPETVDWDDPFAADEEVAADLHGLHGLDHSD
jgi:hypothetical protein